MRGGVIAIVAMVSVAHAQPRPYTPLYQPPADPLAYHTGGHFDLDCGIAILSGGVQQQNYYPLVLGSTPGPACGIEGGLWFGRQVDIDIRAVASVTASNRESVYSGFIGPVLQVWFDENVWAGIGVGGLGLDGTDVGINGFAYEARFGVSLGNSAAADAPGPRHRLTVSIEAISGSVSDREWRTGYNETGSVLSVLVLLGYTQL